MTRAAWSVLVTLAVLLSAGAAALERASPEAMRRRSTSTIDENSARPLYRFSMRGRPDPFVPFVFTAVRREPQRLAISELAFTGFIGSGLDVVALFSHRLSGTNYTLRGSRLFSSDNRPVEDVRGRLLPNRDVRLTQGDRTVVYSTFQGRSR